MLKLTFCKKIFPHLSDKYKSGRRGIFYDKIIFLKFYQGDFSCDT